MTLTVFRIALLRLWNNKHELLLALLLPVLFFSIFAFVFVRGLSDESPKVEFAVIDADQSGMTRDIVELLDQETVLQRVGDVHAAMRDEPLDQQIREIVRDADVDLLIAFPAGLERQLGRRQTTPIRVYRDGTNPIGVQIASPLIAKAAASAMPMDITPTATSSPTWTGPEIRRLPLPPDGVLEEPIAPSWTEIDMASSGGIRLETVELFAADKHRPKIAMYAAGIAVMFLLFSANGAGGSLLEEYEAGTLDRLLASRLTIGQLLAGKWIFITSLGCVQLLVMFLWARLAYQVDLAGHLLGFGIMTFCTAAASASLAIFLAALCRSRAQLNGVSVILVLTMSALGGSMVPRYIMSEDVRRWGKITFNAWSLDGFQKVFWYELPASALKVEAAVLLGMSVVLVIAARVLAQRWATR